MMIKHIITGLTFSIWLVIADVDETLDYGAFLLASNDEFPDDSATNDFLLSSGGELLDSSLTEVTGESIDQYSQPLDDSLQSATEGGFFASTQQPDCTSSNGNTENLFLLSRVRPRDEIDKCLPPLTPPPNIYDSDSILNQLAPPQTLPTIPGTEKSDREKLEEMLGLPEFIPATNSEEQDDVCPVELVGNSQTPVCSSGNVGRDHLRQSGEDFFTLYNVRHCTSQEIRVVFAR